MLPEIINEKIEKMEARTLEIIQEITDDVQNVLKLTHQNSMVK